MMKVGEKEGMIPKSYKGDVSHPQAGKWRAEMEAEYKSLRLEAHGSFVTCLLAGGQSQVNRYMLSNIKTVKSIVARPGMWPVASHRCQVSILMRHSVQ